MFNIDEQNYINLLKFFLSIENLEWAAYLLRDLFNL